MSQPFDSSTGQIAAAFDPSVTFADTSTLADGTSQKVLSKKEMILNQGKKQRASSYLRFKYGYWDYQENWRKNCILRKTDQDRMYVLQAPMGAGKTHCIKGHLLTIENAHHGEKSLSMVTVPNNSQEVCVDIHNTIVGNLPPKTGIMYSSDFEERLQAKHHDTFIYSDSPKAFAHWAKAKDHIICFGSHMFFRDKISPLLDDEDVKKVFEDHDKNAIIEEAHGELHTDGREDKKVYQVNSENPVSSYSELGINTIEKLIKHGFTVTGFTATASLQQMGLTDYESLFTFIPFTDDGFDIVHFHNTFLDKVTKIHIDLTAKNPREDHAKKVAKQLEEDVYNRTGRTQFAVKSTENPGALDEYTYEGFVEDILPHLPKKPVIGWFGGDEKFVLVPQKDGKYVKKYYGKGTNIDDVLEAYPDAKVIVVKKLLKQGFDHPEINTITFGCPINKTYSFTDNLQFIGRGTRRDQKIEPDKLDGLRIIFATQTKGSHKEKGKKVMDYNGFKNADALIDKLLNDRYMLEEDAWKEHQETFELPKYELFSKKSARKLFYAIAGNIEKLEKVIQIKFDGYKKMAEVYDGMKIDLELQDLSSELSTVEELHIGILPNAVKTGGTNEEDVFYQDPFTNIVYQIDVKSKVLEISNSAYFKDYKNNRITLRDHSRADGKINNHIVHVIFGTKFDHDTLSEIVVSIVVIPKEYSDDPKNIDKYNSINYDKLIKDCAVFTDTIPVTDATDLMNMKL